MPPIFTLALYNEQNMLLYLLLLTMVHKLYNNMTAYIKQHV